MNVTVTIPDDIAERLGSSDIARRALEAFGVEEYRAGRLTPPELRRLLGFSTRTALDAFLKARQVHAPFDADDFDRDRRDLDGLGL